jgi:probable phosphoglycerate mutase
MPSEGARSIRLLVVRHGETQANAELRYMGQDDSPLTERGRAQVRAIAERLAHVSVNGLFASDLPRAAKTAEAIGSALGLPVRYDARLRERHVGILRGLTIDEARDRYPQAFDELDDVAVHTPIPGGESASDFRARIAAFVDDLLAERSVERALLIAHGGTARALLWHLLDVPYRAVRWARCDNTSVSVFARKHGIWVLERWNDAAHLDEELAG